MAHRSILRLFTRLRRNEDGVAAIEFGIVASVLILLMVMATDLGLVIPCRLVICDL